MNKLSHAGNPIPGGIPQTGGNIMSNQQNKTPEQEREQNQSQTQKQNQKSSQK